MKAKWFNMTQRQVGCWQPTSFIKIFLLQSTKKIIFQRFGDYWLLHFCDSIWTFCDCGV